MNIIIPIVEYLSSAENFTKAVLLVLLIFYTFYALVLTFQIFSFNRLMLQKPFAPVFQLVAILHAALSFILLLLVVAIL